MLMSFEPFVDAEITYRRERVIADFPHRDRRDRRDHRRLGRMLRGIPQWRSRHQVGTTHGAGRQSATGVTHAA
ncbi:MAG: hypothetical protein QOK39_2347 [Acidimicrobiaceae bacterium]|jgi:hypothetical protein|nr:hypothetical protein [Acidimicrobiaceae bacterium]